MRLLLLGLLALSVASCSTVPLSPSAAPHTPTVILHGGDVFTADPARPRAQALAVSGARRRGGRPVAARRERAPPRPRRGGLSRLPLRERGDGLRAPAVADRQARGPDAGGAGRPAASPVADRLGRRARRLRLERRVRARDGPPLQLPLLATRPPRLPARALTSERHASHALRPRLRPRRPPRGAGAGAIARDGRCLTRPGPTLQGGSSSRGGPPR